MPKLEWNMLESKLCILDDVFIKIFKRCCNKNLNSEHITFLQFERTGLFIYLFIPIINSNAIDLHKFKCKVQNIQAS